MSDFDLFSSAASERDAEMAQRNLLSFAEASAPADAILDGLAAIMRELAFERRHEGVTVARVIHVAKARGVDCGPEGKGANSRAGSWRAVLGKRAGLVPNGQTERVPPEWFPGSHFNRQSVWALPEFVGGSYENRRVG